MLRACLSSEIEESWRRALEKEFEKPYFISLSKFVDDAYRTETVFPERRNLFKAFFMTPFDDVKVVILGQDPYHEPGQAQGLAFYVPDSVKTPPSLKNIAKELGHAPDLISWAKQGVLLLNSILTVKSSSAGSHRSRGWEEFTDAVVKTLSERRENLVFILWGAYAEKKGAVIDASKHKILKSAHPSPLSARRGFFGSKPFTAANEFLALNKIGCIDW